MKEPKLKFVIDNGAVIKSPMYERPGYIFVGWYKEKEFVNQWNFEKDKLMEDNILYASWKKIRD